VLPAQYRLDGHHPVVSERDNRLVGGL
jgi:hypothetical protein